MADDRAGVIWLDFNGVTRQTIIQSLAGAAAIWTAAQACSLAQIQATWESPLGPAVGTQINGNYQSNKMSATLQFQTAAGSIVRLTLPAPNRVVFMPDGTTIDPTNPNIAALIAACIGSLSDGAGNAAVSYLGGTLDPARNDLPPVG